MDVNKYKLTPSPREIGEWNNADEVYVSIVIGNAQIGGSKITNETKVLAKGDLSQSTHIGSIESLKGKSIDLVTNVMDVNHFTSKCVITTTFYNENNKVIYTKIDSGDAPEDGVASFIGTYLFKVIGALIFLFGFSNFSIGQITNDLAFQNLETPSSPGFILMDQTPSSIERPTTPQGFGIGILGVLEGAGGAVEVAPFWLMDHPKLSSEDVYKKHRQLIHNFSFSAASIKTDTSNLVTGGFRTRPYQQFSSSQIKKLDSLKGMMVDLLADGNFDELKALQKSYMGVLEKPVFTIDFAGAMGGSSATNSFNDLMLSRWALWTSVNWRPRGNDFYTTLLIRYVKNEQFRNYSDNSDLFDVGARLNYDIGKFSASMEYIYRHDSVNDMVSDYRLAAIGSYQLSSNFYLTATFGKDFTNVNNVLALAGVNFGFSKTKLRAF
ncbi:MAG: hypothetical protein MK066_03710 [Crocinitomicaceae bacterium]|nr:hypothetical protein [Crocinitomicaceae bacterium]